MVNSQALHHHASTKKLLLIATGLVITAVVTVLFFLLLGTSREFALFNPISVSGLLLAILFFIYALKQRSCAKNQDLPTDE
ncbi:hypothetical protein ACUY3R_07810 [Corynebacterium sp. 23_3061]